MSRTVLLSLDWDFWIPEDEGDDWGHTEGHSLLQNYLWHMRVGTSDRNLVEEMQPTGVDLDALKVIPTLVGLGYQVAADCKLTVSDSHAYAYAAFFEYVGATIVNIDAHHDLGYKYSCNGVSCENWAKQLLRRCRRTRAVQVYPSWKGLGEWDDSAPIIPAWVKKVATGDEYSPEYLRAHAGVIQAVHFARSSPWAPPWCDHVAAQAIQQLEVDLGTSAKLYSYQGEDPRVPRKFDPKLVEVLRPTSSWYESIRPVQL